jgi:sortase A
MVPWSAPRVARRGAKSLRYLEVAAWTLGTLLLATYAGAQWWYAHGRDEGIAAFAAARDEAMRSPLASAARRDLSASRVDMSTWSPERIARYRESQRAPGVPLAVLRIPAVKLAVPVFDGTSEQNLNRGAGRIAGTAQIGEPGNVGIAAHRDGFFRALKDVQIDDLLLLERLGATDAYRIVSTRVVDPSDMSVLAPTATHSVTLVTCFPFYYVGSAPRRFIVHAERMSTKKTPAGKMPAGVEGRVAIGRLKTLSDDGDTTSTAHRNSMRASR